MKTLEERAEDILNSRYSNMNKYDKNNILKLMHIFAKEVGKKSFEAGRELFEQSSEKYKTFDEYFDKLSNQYYL